MSAVQKIRLPSVNDIFPKKVEPQLIHTQHPLPQYNTSAPQLSLSSPIETPQNYTLHQQQVPYPIQHPHPAQIQQHHPHSQQIPQEVPVSQPMPYYPQNMMPIPHRHHPQQHPGVPITPSHSPINYVSSQQMAIPVYNYQQPRHGIAMGSVMPHNKYKISKGSPARQSNAWSSNDDELLKHLKEVKNLGWREISMYFENRTANGCQFRWRRIVALSKQQQSFQETIKRKDTAVEPVETGRSNSLESLLN